MNKTIFALLPALILSCMVPQDMPDQFAEANKSGNACSRTWQEEAQEIVIAGEDTYLSETAQAACEEYGEEYGICPEFLEALIERESSGKPDAQNGKCCGLCQISTRWHKDRMERLGVTDIYDERSNIHVAADYLAELFGRYEDPVLVLDIYHGAQSAQTNFETGTISGYAEWILDRSAELERVHGK